MFYHKILAVILALFIGIQFLCGCAKQGYPPGGPIDKTGPVIVSSYPLPESIGVGNDISPWILLDEHPARKSIEGSVFISPEPEEGFSLKIRGKRIKVSFNEDLPENSTVVITFGAGIKDINGNQMAESYVLAFSTGDMIDNGQISGYIEGLDNPGSAWLWAYPLDSLTNPDPKEDKAPFATQPDYDGNFILNHLPQGKYRLFAVEDTRRNRLWDSDREAIAIPAHDVQSKETDIPVVSLRLTMIDLVSPTLRTAEAINRQAIRLSFDEDVEIIQEDISAETQLGQKLGIIDIYQDPADSSAAYLTTGIQREGDVYKICLEGVRDLSGNMIDSIFVDVAAVVDADTSGPRFTWNSPKDGAIEVEWDEEIMIGFSEAVNLTTISKAIRVMTPDSIVIAGKWSYPASNLAVFYPDEFLLSNMSYTVAVNCDSITDVFGNASTDSVVTVSFSTLNSDEVGSLSGQVIGAPQNLRIFAKRLELSSQEREESVLENGNFAFENLPASFYQLSIYQDQNGDGRYSFGSIDPFIFSEPFTTSGDTIRVRPRWETEGVAINWNFITPGFEQAPDSLK